MQIDPQDVINRLTLQIAELVKQNTMLNLALEQATAPPADPDAPVD